MLRIIFTSLVLNSCSYPRFYFFSWSLCDFATLDHSLGTLNFNFPLQYVTQLTSLSLSNPLAISDEGSCYSPNLLEPHSQLLCPFQQWSHEREEREHEPANSLKMSTIFLKHIFDHVILCLKNSSDSLAWYSEIFQSQAPSYFPNLFSIFFMKFVTHTHSLNALHRIILQVYCIPGTWGEIYTCFLYE